jgi:hypothetical protein
VADLRREFTLPKTDSEYLDGLCLLWETIKSGNQQWLLIHNWKVVPGYSSQEVTVALLIDTNYSDVQIDSFYVFPALKRSDGNSIKNAAGEAQIDGKGFQFWSRHRSQNNPWRPGVDDISSHLALVMEWMKRSLSD